MNKSIRTIFVSFFTFFALVTACSTPTNTTIDSNKFNNISKSINQAVINQNKINKQNKTFSTKSVTFQNQGVQKLALPFNCSYSCDSNNTIANASASYSDGRSETFGPLAGLYIGADGSVSLGVSSPGGDLYAGNSISITGNISSKPYFKGSESININFAALPCGLGSGGSIRTHGSSAITNPTYFLRSGTGNISVSGSDLIANVSGITSDNIASWTAPWDGSCRLTTHPDTITSGDINITIKNVVPKHIIKGTIANETIGTDTAVEPNPAILSTNISINSTSSAKPWTMKITGDQTCPYDKTYSGVGNKDIIFPDGVDVKDLKGTYNIEVYYDDEPSDKATSSITVQNKVALDVTPTNIDLTDTDTNNDKVLIKATAPNCPTPTLKITGEIIKATIEGSSCSIDIPISDSGYSFDGKCKGSYYKDSATVTLTSGDKSDTKSIQIKLPTSLSCKADEVYDAQLGICCPVGSGCNVPPSPSPDPSVNPSPSVDPSSSPDPNPTPSITISNTPKPSTSSNPSSSPDPNPTPSITISNTPKPSTSSNPSSSPNPSTSNPPSPTPIPTATTTASPSPSPSPSATPSNFTIDSYGTPVIGNNRVAEIKKQFSIASKNTFEISYFPIGTCGKPKHRIAIELNNLAQRGIIKIEFTLDIVDRDFEQTVFRTPIIFTPNLDEQERITVSGGHFVYYYDWDGKYSQGFGNGYVPANTDYKTRVVPLTSKETVFDPISAKVVTLDGDIGNKIGIIQVRKPFSIENDLLGTFLPTFSHVEQEHFNEKISPQKGKFLETGNNIDLTAKKFGINDLKKYIKNIPKDSLADHSLEYDKTINTFTGDVDVCSAIYRKSFGAPIGKENGINLTILEIILNLDGKIVTAYPVKP